MKWKLFNRSKSKKEEKEKNQQSPQNNKDNQVENEDDSLVEFSETLYTKDSVEKQSADVIEDSEISDQRVWRNVESIEKNIDDINHIKKDKNDGDIEKKIDKLISNVKQKHRKPANVIYVVSSPQPGEVRGDWAVKSHDEVFSHHKTKDNAIKAARNIAKQRDATVLVQNTDGTFSDGFKPRR